MLEAQLWPAARANATAAASATTAGERATNAFTVSLLCLVRDRPGNRAFSLPAGVVIEIPGFASPSRGEFAPGESAVVDLGCPLVDPRRPEEQMQWRWRPSLPLTFVRCEPAPGTPDA